MSLHPVPIQVSQEYGSNLLHHAIQQTLVLLLNVFSKEFLTPNPIHILYYNYLKFPNNTE